MSEGDSRHRHRHDQQEGRRLRPGPAHCSIRSRGPSSPSSSRASRPTTSRAWRSGSSTGSRAFARRFDIGAMAVTTHGATMVCVDDEGQACAPCVYYTHEPGPEFQERFYALAGDRRELQATTGTPPLSAMINPSKGLLFLKERFPEAFARARTVLNYPQYWGLRLTGRDRRRGHLHGLPHLPLGLGGGPLFLGRREARRRGDAAPSPARLLGGPGRDQERARGANRAPGRPPRHDGHPRLERLAAAPPRQGPGQGLHPQLDRHLVRAHASPGPLRLRGGRARQGRVLQPLGLQRAREDRHLPRRHGVRGLDAAPSAAASSLVARPGRRRGLRLRRRLRPRSFILPELVPGSGQFPGSAPRAVQDGREYALADIESGRSVPPFMRDGGAGPRRAQPLPGPADPGGPRAGGARGRDRGLRRGRLPDATQATTPPSPPSWPRTAGARDTASPT